MPRHIFRLILFIVAFGVVGYGAKRFFTVNSFYEYGHYRGNSVADIASDKPKYKGVGYCASCHADQLAEWSKGVHNSTDIGKIVRCEVCHGAAGERDVRGMFEASATGPDHPNNLKLIVPTDTRKLCTLCHERLTGRPCSSVRSWSPIMPGRSSAPFVIIPIRRSSVWHPPKRRRKRAMPSPARPRLLLARAVTAPRASAETSPARASLDRTRPISSKRSRPTARAGATIR